MKIGENIRKIRDLKGFSQQILADMVNISQKQLSRIESNQTSPTLELVEKICEALGIQLKNLLEFDGDIIFQNINNSQQGGEFVTYNNTDVKQIENLYNKLLEEKDKIITLLQKQIEK